MNKKFDVQVDEYTTPDPATISAHESISQVRAIMDDCGFRHILVVEDKKAIGIISQRDILKNFTKGDNLTAADIMQKEIYRVKYFDSLEKVAFDMSRKKIGSALVENENGEIHGIFTTTDALNALVEILRDEI